MVNVVRFASWGSMMLALALACAGCATRTEVLLVVDSDISGLNQITVDMASPSGAHQMSSATIGVGDLPLPRTLGLTWSSGALGPYTVVVTGLHSGTTLVSRTATFTFVQNETRVLHVDLLQRCTGVVCGAGQTCGEMGCGSSTVPPIDLTPYTGSVGRSTDSAIGPPVDAAVPMDIGPDDGCPTPAAQQVDPRNCGMCGNVCALDHVMNNACGGGRCQVGTCEPGWDDCDGRNSTGCELDVTSDRDNCGRCGRMCRGATPVCCHSMCAASCP